MQVNKHSKITRPDIHKPGLWQRLCQGYVKHLQNKVEVFKNTPLAKRNWLIFEELCWLFWVIVSLAVGVFLALGNPKVKPTEPAPSMSIPVEQNHLDMPNKIPAKPLLPGGEGKRLPADDIENTALINKWQNTVADRFSRRIRG